MSVYNYKTSITQVGVLDCSSSPTRYIFRAPERCIISSIYIVNGTTKAANDTNWLNIAVANLGSDGAGTTSVATRKSNVAGGVITADVPAAMVLSTTAANLEMAAGDVLQITATEGATGQGDTDAECAFIVNWIPGSGAGQ